eukprot:TRINITY_DN2083_c1_g1_i1.p1 TRINITY_DN2083_c1_g1~~TRINITY_DN2083_c1_g1_i1.p1  ORF type:complete len:178 (+),score=40.80 TRINITY_DN2083_c1_g1_i1:27-536(+)
MTDSLSIKVMKLDFTDNDKGKILSRILDASQKQKGMIEVLEGEVLKAFLVDQFLNRSRSPSPSRDELIKALVNMTSKTPSPPKTPTYQDFLILILINIIFSSIPPSPAELRFKFDEAVTQTTLSIWEMVADKIMNGEAKIEDYKSHPDVFRKVREIVQAKNSGDWWKTK